ncbi:vancomycin resistance protein VanW [Hydrogenoanaerobacterium saccharovorans]|uniref:Vancomycin resistance protein VanW n=1 Tax=Hydrogenoanaerobacterium saccharovorans TaxID=474960 RepID=A0A1H8CJD7_9FIRM|nr:VanW family protein [Hydrogenoanaerobacterium saccharovorans]RPF43100.1 vancomycin resistance protein VanW [Hydrogenoanaerobacterium saccharovorans]SEM94207.1 vancomycin resistance protein VanW [Hydrogenoanaerobacterium saccharovorans]
MSTNNNIAKPKRRSKLRAKMGMLYYGLLRKLLWIKLKPVFAVKKADAALPYLHFCHKTPLLRKLKDVDMWYQYNKIINLKIAVKQINGIVLHPGEIFSFWKLIGKPTKHKGYVNGMVLRNGTFTSAIGGGLCQLSNLIFWMTLHTPLTVTERHRHGYDVFPDSNRTQPFGSGATCFYPHGDLMIHNDTPYDFQLVVTVTDKYLEGKWYSTKAQDYRYKVTERNHEMKGEYWGGYSRHNELYREIFDKNGNYISEEFILSNSAIMMYSPFLCDSADKQR